MAGQVSREIAGMAPPLGTSLHGRLFVDKDGDASLEALRLI